MAKSKKPIAAILADTHLEERNAEVVKSIFQQAIEYAKSIGLQQIEHAGDLFHFRKAQSQPNLTVQQEIFDMFSKEDMILNIVVGNHDKTEYTLAKSFLEPYQHHPALNIYKTFGRASLTKDINLNYLSYFADEEYIAYYKELIEQDSFEKKNILLTHIGVEGAVMNNGTKIESKISPSLFKEFDLVLIGHYHDAQNIDDKVKYIGASLQHNYGELTGKGLTVLYDDLSIETIPLRYPQYIKYEVDPKQITVKDIKELKAEKESSGDNIRVILVGSDAEIKSFNKQLLFDAGISVEKRTEEIEVEELEQSVTAFTAQNLKDEFKGYCEKHNLNYTQGQKYFKAVIQ